MPAILRQDGEQFAVYTYRELLTIKKTALLKREIQLLKEEHGQYARFYWQDTGDIEAVFSRDPGYLLAESAWLYFKSPKDLLYCERLPQGDTALLVVIRNDSVYLDSQVPVDNLIDEFEALANGDNQYDIYIYGDIPLAQTPTDGVFSFHSEFVKSFHALKSSALAKLPLNNDFLLLPTDQAVADLKLKEMSIIPFLIGILAIGVIGYFGYQELKPAPPPPAPVVVNPYAQYEQQLMSPAPKDILIQTAKNIELLYTIPGWAPKQLTYQAGSLNVNLAPELLATGDLLLHWLKHYNMDVGIGPGSAILKINLGLPPRPQPKTIYILKETLSEIFDQTRLLLPGATLSFNTPTTKGVYSTTDVTVNFSGVSSIVLVLYAQVLNGKPVVISNMNFTIDAALLSGRIQLTLLGV